MRGKLQFSLLTLAGLVVFTAVACVGMSRASDGWAAALFTAALVAPLFCVVGGVYLRGGPRAYCVGAAVLTWGYLAIAYGPWIGPRFEPQLATTQFSNWLHPKLMKRVPIPPPPSNAGGGYAEMDDYASMMGGYKMEDMDVMGSVSSMEDSYGYDGGYGGMGPGMMGGGFRTIGPRLTDVRLAGHALFAMLLGLLGGAVARKCQQQQRASE